MFRKRNYLVVELILGIPKYLCNEINVSVATSDGIYSNIRISVFDGTIFNLLIYFIA